ncbi:lipoprotein-releasing ABC transporter permease subunit LolE [Ferrimonas sediminicola]|uniref:Lipoprotein-releasing ABC transporter permease subunit LolE n=1 Tax=Ferrimonas sediminicola TaxID=2569538 RepID=A0A4U1BDY0_9GAMM|nr:lipoprotein-releasing ABC transporter permease subunit LolE [Ferrimonas sediminicola]TKB49015.1 lipoprotein-releasing ABC transporter permease subunit LolE [Ferrimonas sediminicola]
MKNLALIWQLGWRFLRTRHSNRFISVISLSSIIGVALGVTVLILVLSAMNGFERELKERLLAVVPQAELIAVDSPILDWQTMAADALSEPGVEAAAPFTLVEGLLQKGEKLKGVSVRGVDPQLERRVSDARRYMPAAAWQSLAGEGAPLVLGKALASELELKLGDRVTLLVPRPTSQGQRPPKRVVFTLTGLFDLGGEIDRTMAFTSLGKASQIRDFGQGVGGLRLKLVDLFDAPGVIRAVGYRQTHYLYLNDWTRTQGHLYADIQLIRSLMYLVLVLMVAVASFNIICSLVMAVRDKQAEIAILRTMGLERRAVMGAFLVQGALTGLTGCLLGAALGSALGWRLSDLVRALEQSLGVTLLSGEVYFIDFLPSQLIWSDVVTVTLLAFLVTVLASLYPAWQAARQEPAQALR